MRRAFLLLACAAAFGLGTLALPARPARAATTTCTQPAGSLIPCPGDNGDAGQQRLPSADPLTGAGDLQGGVNLIVTRVLNFIYLVLGGVAVLMLLYAGIQYITANGSADVMKKARQNITNVVFGIVLLASSYAVIRLIVAIAQYFAR